MKEMFKAMVSDILALFARGVIVRYKPKILMVTGSVGKTSTKDAIAAVLGKRLYLRASEKSYNSEFGVPFTIFGVKNPWRDVWGWVRVFKEAFSLLLLPNHYPALLVLEVGADRPGDLARIMRIVTPDIVVVTKLPDVPVHVEAYASPQAVREEEFLPAYYLPAGGPLILSAADEHALKMSERLNARVITYGKSAHADVHFDTAECHVVREKVVGMEAHVTFGEHSGKVVVNGSVGGQQIRPALAAIAVASLFDMSLKEAIEALGDYLPPPGRGRLLPGMKGSTLIDDSYNASPVAVEKALETLKEFHGAKRRIAVIGDMLELGRYSVVEHERVGEQANKTADILVTVGIRARAAAARAKSLGMSEAAVMSFDDAFPAAQFLKEVIKEGDVILIKGSQSIRTERIVEALLADPADRAKLVRQEPEWKRK